MKTSVIDVGGGLRDIFATGVFDWCLDNDVNFDLGIGVSAGSANLSTFAAKQKGRNLRFYTEHSMAKEYMSLGNFLKRGSYIDLDYVYSTLSNEDGKDPLDYEMLAQNPMDMIVVAAEAETGNAKYFTKADMSKNNYDILKASSAIPFICKPYEIDGVKYYDGALGDPVPIRKAINEGSEKTLLLLSRPIEAPRTPGTDPTFARFIKRRYPHAAKAMKERANRYNHSVDFAKSLVSSGEVLILAPEDTFGVDTLTRDVKALHQLYQAGYDAAPAIKDWLKE